MLAKEHRLKKTDFAKIYKQGKRLSNKNFLLIFNFNKKKQGLFAVVVSKKIAKLAIQRNKTRRFVYDELKNNLEQVPANLNIIIHCRTKLDNNNKVYLKKSFWQLINKLNEKNSPRTY